jgi:hypothetical protein
VSASAPHNPQSQKASAISDAVGRIEEGRSVVRPSTLPEPEPVRAFPRFDTFVAKTDSIAPDIRKDLEKMARRRYQNPKPFKEGAFWWLLLWQDEFVNGVRTRKRKRVKLAPATMAVREARKVAGEFTGPLNQGLVSLGSATNFTEYVSSTYMVNEMPLLAASTRERYSGVIKNYLVPTFGSMCLRDLTPMTIQRYFSGMAGSELGHESIDKIRDVLSSILGSAKKYALLVTNPVEGIELPPSKRGSRIKPYINPAQFLELIELIPEPYASMVFVAIFTGLRVSEVIGLKWRNVHADSITVDEEIVRRGLVLYTFGNASGIDRETGLVAIKPSGISYETLQTSDIVVTDLDGSIVEGHKAHGLFSSATICGYVREALWSVSQGLFRIGPRSAAPCPLGDILPELRMIASEVMASS